MQILTTPFYITDLTVYGFWHLKEGGPGTNPPEDTEEALYLGSVLTKEGLAEQSQVFSYLIH